MPLCLKKSKNRAHIVSRFRDYLNRDHRPELLQLSSLDDETHRSIVVHFNLLCEFDNVFSELLLFKPVETLALLDEGLRESLYEGVCERQSHKLMNLHVRFTALPVIPEVHRNVIPRATDAGKFIALRATVNRVGPVQVHCSEAVYRCSVCGFLITVCANFETFYSLDEPRKCTKCGEHKYGSLNKVNDTRFRGKNCQEITVHEPYRCLSVGVVPRSITVCVEDDLLESVKPGDDVVINGFVLYRWKLPRLGAFCNISMCFKANYIENLSEMRAGSTASRIASDRILEFESYWRSAASFPQALDLRNRIVNSICPDVYGMFLVKLSLALLLAGAPEWQGDSETIPSPLRFRTRGSPHMLLIGDPGTAKSVLLRTATNLSHRSVLTAATGTTAAGLTATAIRDTNGWTLDAGALVLADGGLCAIDEFTALQGTHRAAVHEAMEQQTVSLAKAGLMARLNCRCSVLAAANPPQGGQKSDFGLQTPLLSRFDLVWRLVDPLASEVWDRRIANFVLNLDEDSTSCVQYSGQKTNPHFDWTTELLRDYFIWVRQEFKPQLSAAAANLLQRYYVWRRQQLVGPGIASVITARTTLRLLESLVRLTKAHARLMARSEANIEDAILVITLMDASLVSTSLGDISHNIASFTASNSITKFTHPETVVMSESPVNTALDCEQIKKAVYEALDGIKNDHLEPESASFFLTDSVPNPTKVKLPVYESVSHTFSPNCYDEQEEGASHSPGLSQYSIHKDDSVHREPLSSSSQKCPAPLKQHTGSSHVSPIEESSTQVPQLKTGGQAVPRWSETETKRARSKLTRFAFRDTTDIPLATEVSQTPKSICSKIENTRPIKRIFDVQLTDEDFEIDI